MQFRRLFWYFLCAAALQAQSISVSSPTASQSLSGWTGSSFSVSLTSAANVSLVCYTVDAHPAVNAGPINVISGSSGALLAAGCANAAPYSFPVNTFWWLNGPHQVVATAYDAAGNVVATSVAVPFTIANSWPVTCTPAITVTPGIPVTSNWSGQVNLQGTITGACSTDSFLWYWYIDGIQQAQAGNSYPVGCASGATQSANLDTTQFLNSQPHNIGLVVLDCTNGQASNGGAVEWTRTVTFANSATGAEVRGNAREIFLATSGAGRTFTLTPSLINTDGSTGSTSFYYAPANTIYATLSASTGASVTVTGAAQGSTPIYVMGQTHSGTDGGSTSILSHVQMTSYTLRPSDLGRMIYNSGGNANCIVGPYIITNVNTNANQIVVGPVSTGFGNTNWASLSGTNCNWALGPTRTIWALVSPQARTTWRTFRTSAPCLLPTPRDRRW